MASITTDGVTGGRLTAEDYARNFGDLSPPLTRHEALVEAERCYFCYDAPCVQSCPTGIDVPLFIRQIAKGNPLGAAETILSANIMGGMCARVCPTEQLCEEACVREHAEGKPVRIGLLQRHATDAMMAASAASGTHPFGRAPASGRSVAVVGAGPAGLAAAHRLATLGHAVTVYDARPKGGGLNEYGIAAYKAAGGFAQAELDFILGVGGIRLEPGVRLGADVTLDGLRAEHDAVFLGLGLGGANALAGADAQSNVVDALGFIEGLRQAADKAAVPVGRRVVVIGGGMTAVDAAVQSRRLGAEEVTIAYRRGVADMKASGWERDLAKTEGVVIRPWMNPAGFEARDGRVSAALFDHRGPDGLGEPERVALPADLVLLAIGQTYAGAPGPEVLAFDGGRIRVDAERRTTLPGVWAGGDCVAGGSDLTVSAVEDGKRAALAIDAHLRHVTPGLKGAA
ncbi:NAD(P)-dependent oxidoreductase [Lichenibacterium dinghuense]|uniref:NAD(P)-dependent oxidoreductase n=1 Tax=Lichenibacterium dinghuense TaxID=2895977 RepID=UPI001F1B9F28|nr:NAD(P)-dependent oxidoreductase [Lichenibacterium sp. 6Y81]